MESVLDNSRTTAPALFARRPAGLLGAVPTEENRCRFLLWAPYAKNVELHIENPRDRGIRMNRLDAGYFEVVADDVGIGAQYRYRLDGQKEYADPASRFQPKGVHGPSQVIDSRFDWQDAGWTGIALRDYVFYELHVGTFTPEGTFEAIIPRVSALKELGVTAIELMPVAQFPGDRNWGYDGAYPYAVQNSYGGPLGLKKLVNACHQQGMAVVFDVVYNHLGPEGNYLGAFGPYFTDVYKTPWGQAVNFDQAQSDEVRRYFICNALQWIAEFHVDALRLDAVQAIIDPSASPFLRELGIACHAKARELKRQVHLIAESDRNDPRIVNRFEKGGWQIDAQWNDDFHHSLRVALTGEQTGYYGDYSGLKDLAKAVREGFIYDGQHSKHRGKHYGAPSQEVPGERLGIFAQKPDQAGHRQRGDRLAATQSFAKLKMAAGLTLLSPYLPMLFMGEEFGERAPFQYFVSHGDPDLVEAIRRGRKKEFSSFEWKGELPDPQDEQTFLRSKVNWELRNQGQHALLWRLCSELLRLRREIPALTKCDKQAMEVSLQSEDRVLLVKRWNEDSQTLLACNFSEVVAEISLPDPPGAWGLQIDSSETRWGGEGSSDAVESAKVEGCLQTCIAPWSFLLWAATVR